MSDSENQEVHEEPQNGNRRTGPGNPESGPPQEPPVDPGRLDILEDALEVVRKEVRGLRDELEPLQEIRDLPNQIKGVEETLGRRREEEEARFAELGRGFQDIADRMSQRMEESAAERKKQAATLDTLRDRIEKLAEGIRNQEGEIGNRFKGLGDELANYGQLLTLMKGMVEKNAVAFRELRDQGKELLTRFQEQNQRLAEEAERSREDEARRHNNDGVALFYRGALDAAAEHFHRATELHPTYPEAFNNLGLAYSRLGKPEEAAQAFQKAVQLDPKMAEALNNLGFLYHSTLEYPRAIEMFRKALLQKGDFAEAYTNLGNSFFKLKQHDRAVAAWKRAIEIDPMNENARRSLRMFDQEGGDRDDGGNGTEKPPSANAPSGTIKRGAKEPEIKD